MGNTLSTLSCTICIHLVVVSMSKPDTFTAGPDSHRGAGKHSPRRLLLGDTAAASGIILFVHTPYSGRHAVELPSNAIVADIFADLKENIDDYDVFFQGEAQRPDKPLADIGLSNEAAVEFRAKPNDCIKLTELFSKTNVYDRDHQALRWRPVTEHDDYSCCDFAGIRCSDRQTELAIERRRIKEISLFDQKMNGALEWRALPQSLEKLNLGINKFTGNVEWHALPRSLEYLDVSYNQFSGNVEWSPLKQMQSLKRLDLSHNQFEGNVEWRSLPQSLEKLGLSHNQFAAGNVEWRALSQSLQHLDLAHNQFAGDVDWRAVKQLQALKYLHLFENQFTGSVDWSALPQSLKTLWLSNNQFSGSVEWSALPRSLVELLLRGNQFTGSVEWTALQQLTSMEWLEIQDNQFEFREGEKEEAKKIAGRRQWQF